MPHATGNTNLSRIEQRRLFEFDALDLGANTRPLQELFDELLMGSHV